MMSEQLSHIEERRGLSKVQQAEVSKHIAQIIITEEWAQRAHDAMADWEFDIDNSSHDFMGILDPRLGIMWVVKRFADARVQHRVNQAERHYRKLELQYVNQALQEAPQSAMVNLGTLDALGSADVC